MAENTNNAWDETPEEVEFRSRRKSSGGGQFTPVVNKNLKQGENVIRLVGRYEFMPSHWFNKIQRNAVCPGLAVCPVCNHPERKKLEVAAQEAQKNFGKGSPQAKEQWRKYFSYEPKERYAINVLDREDGKLKVWKFGSGVKNDIAKFKNRYNLAECDLVVTREGEGLKTKYTVFPLPPSESKPFSEEELAQIAKPINLKAVYKPTPVETVEAFLRGEIPAKKSRPAPQETSAEAAPESHSTELPPELNHEGPSEEDLSDLGDLGGF